MSELEQGSIVDFELTLCIAIKEKKKQMMRFDIFLLLLRNQIGAGSTEGKVVILVFIFKQK